jgi:sugar O-acyltransferase (sialic acid O-acetyltransferase NeuD family)
VERLAIIGSADLGQLIADHATTDRQYEVIGFFDDFRAAGEVTDRGPVLGGLSDVEPIFEQGRFDALMIGVGYRHPAFRRQCHDRFAGSIPFARLIHSSCFVDPTAQVGDGAFLLPGCNLDKGVVVEENALLNTGCTVAHDSRVGRHSFLGPGVVVAGFAVIGQSCFIGVGSTIIDNVRIADDVQTGGGAVVTGDIFEPGLYLGVPARKQPPAPASPDSDKPLEG